MKKEKNISQIVRNKIKHLRKDKLYDYSIFENIVKENSEAFRKSISRLALDGEIIKVGNKKFYKQGDREYKGIINHARIKPMEISKKNIRKQYIPSKLLKSRLSSNLFWSNPNGKIPVDNVIYSLIKNDAISDLDFVRFNYGDERVIKVFMEKFNINDKPMIRDILNV